MNSCIEYFKEEFRPIMIENGRLLSEYIISNQGHIYSLNLNRYLNETEIKGYLSVSLRIDEKFYAKRINRLVMMTFCPIANPECYQVNHLNGNKKDNHLWNLEWATPKQNIQHAYETGLINILGEKHPDSKISDKEAEKIFEYLEQGIDYQEMYGLIQPNIDFKTFRKIVYRIRYGDSRIRMSKNYNFDKSKQRYTKYNVEDIHRICQYLEKGYSYNQICDEFNIQDKYDRKLFKRVILSIVNQKSYTNISCNYKIMKQKGLRDNRFTDEQIEDICKELSQKKDSLTILRNLGIDIDSIPKSEKTNYLRSINSIRKKKSFTQISNKYF